MWPLLAIAGGSALLNYQQAKDQQKAQAAQNMAAAEQTRWSPWSGMGKGQLDLKAVNPATSAIGGGLQGYMVGSNMSQGQAMDALKQEKMKAEIAKLNMQNSLQGYNPNLA